MKIHRSQSKKKMVVVILSLVLLAAVLGLGYYFLLLPSQKTTKADDINYQPPTQEQVEAGSDIKKGVIEKDQSSQTSADTSSFTVTISDLSVQSSELRIRSEIDGVYQNGTCSLTLTRGSKAVKKTSGIQPLAQLTVCKGFDVALSELSKGVWKVLINVEINGATSSASGEITI